MRHVAVIAHSGKLQPKAKRALRAALRDAGDEVLWLAVDKGPQATKMAERAVREGAEVVIAAGGDGTVRAAAEALVHTGTPLAVVPAGTANLFAHAMHMPSDPAEVVALIASGASRTVDTGSCNGRTFTVIAGAGFDAALTDATEAHKERLGTLAYFRAGAEAARKRRRFPVRLALDGNLVFDGGATAVIVGNVSTLQGGIVAFPDASPTDGVLDVAVITASGARAWASLVWAAARQRQHATPHGHLWQARRIQVDFPAKHRFELDGGVKGRAKRLDISVEPASLTICAPPAP